MEKFYDLIPSESVKKLSKEKRCELTPFDCILLVNQCKKLSIKEKHALYNEIIETMPEPDVLEAFLKETHTELSLYEIIREYMRLEKSDLEEFLKDADEPVYGYDRTTLSEALAELAKEDTSLTEIENHKIGYEAIFLDNGEIEHIRNCLSYKERPYDRIFDYSVELAVPFKKGDLVYYSFDNGHPCLCLFDSLAESNERGFASHANVYVFLSSDTGIHLDVVPCSSLDYYTKQLTYYEKSYKIVSDYFKGKIDFEVFFNSYLVLAKDEEYKRIRFIHSDDYLAELFPEEE